MKDTSLEGQKAQGAMPKITRRLLTAWCLLSWTLLPLLTLKFADEAVRKSAAVKQLSTLSGTDAYPMTLEVVANLTSPDWLFHGLLATSAVMAAGGLYTLFVLNKKG